MSASPYRILVTGSRDWKTSRTIHSALAKAAAGRALNEIIITHGACPTGADAIAHQWARLVGVKQEPHPADWDLHGRAAGPRRNKRMVDLGADVCLAFIRNGSRGATGCADLAEAAGIPTTRWVQ